MRLWSVDPRYLDDKGLKGCWAETLLAQAILLKNTKGCKYHPQLERFKIPYWNLYLSNYLWGIYDEGRVRGINFDRNKIKHRRSALRLTVTEGQLRYEYRLLNTKLKVRDKKHVVKIQRVMRCHPLFTVVKGTIAKWERVKEPA